MYATQSFCLPTFSQFSFCSECHPYFESAFGLSLAYCVCKALQCFLFLRNTSVILSFSFDSRASIAVYCGGTGCYHSLGQFPNASHCKLKFYALVFRKEAPSRHLLSFYNASIQDISSNGSFGHFVSICGSFLYCLQLQRWLLL